MNTEIIKEALSYDLASDLHETWRLTRKKADGTYEPRIKKSTDEAWNIIHATNEVDIANTKFSELPSNWQYENLQAARVTIELVYDKVSSNEQFTLDEIEQMACIIHEEWLKRNDWVFNPKYGNPKLALPYKQLPKEEQDKDKAQLVPAQEKVKAYLNGLINIDEICLQYNLINKIKRL